MMDRFWSKVEKTTTCWLWTACLNWDGYGQFGIGPKGTNRRAHRLAYEWLVGPIPAGLELDHLCGVRRCVNPSHLEPVTHAENVRRGDHHCRRKTHCPAGHEYNDENTRVSNGRRFCRVCAREAYARKKAA